MMTVDSYQLYRLPAPGREPVRVTGNVWGSDDPTVSPDGTTLAYDTSASGNDDVVTVRLPGGAPVDLTPGTPSDDYEPAWSPDGRRIAFISDRSRGRPEVFVMNADGTGVVQVTHDGLPHELPSWSPDGKTILFDTSSSKVNGDIWAVGADGTGLRRFTSSPRDEWGARWSPDGTWIAYTTDIEGRGKIFLMHPGGSDAHLLRTRQPDDDLGYPAWSPGGTLAYSDVAGDCGIYTIALDGTHRKLISKPCLATNSTEADTYDMSWAPDGSFWFADAAIAAQDLATIGADGGDAVTLTRTDNTLETQPAWSPDGTTIAYVSDASNASNDIWSMNADGAGRRALTRTPNLDEAEPAWSPDGARLAYAANGGAHGRVEIYVMQRDGSAPRRLTTLPGDNFEPAWSPDGKAIAFGNGYRRQYSVYVERLDGSGLTRLGRGEEATWSPDGKTIAYLRQGHIWLMNADGSGAHAVIDGQSPSWSPDGTQIAFQRTFALDKHGNKRDEIWVMHADGTGPHRIAVACDDAFDEGFSGSGNCGVSAGPRWGP